MQNSTTAVNLGLLMTNSVTDESDEDLMLRYRDGDAAAFELLYARHKEALFHYFIRQCSLRSVAEELFQDSWMSIIKARKNYRVSAKFRTYMYSIAHNKLIDYYRRFNINTTNAEDYNDAVNELHAPSCQQPERLLALNQKQKLLHRALKQLPESQREVFLLREQSGLTLEEIAEITSAKKETVKSRLRYAVVSLKRIIKVGES